MKNKVGNQKEKELRKVARVKKKEDREFKRQERLKNIPKEPMRNVWLDWIKIVISVATAAGAIWGVFYGVEKIINKNYNEQTQVVIEPREGDIIVRDGDDYKLLQLIKLEDIIFPTKVQEIQIKPENSVQDKRVDINNNKNEDWTNRNSFKYVINNFSINPNKVINLLENISSIVVYCDFYEQQNISTIIDVNNKEFSFEMRNSIEQKDFKVTHSNIQSPYEYVTKETNNGIEWVKIRVEIVYVIGDRHIADTLTSNWIATDADIF